jgi:glutathione synthase/RimK-type ligase-like ATP-grasp enzyme
MKIAIHKGVGFCERWIKYCEINAIDYKLVNAYDTDIVTQLNDCEVFMWHFSHINYKDMQFAKHLLFSLQISGKKTFPDFNTCWHFDDKIAQKYLLESIKAPLVNSYVFYTKSEVKSWIQKTDFPKVFKLKGGAGSSNVLLVENAQKALKLTKTAFGKGFKQYNAFNNLKERWRKYRLNKTNFTDVLKGFVRFVYPSDFARFVNNEKAYVYFQDFVPNNKHDIRVVLVDDKAFAIKRLTRKNDFRASGSGFLIHDKEQIDERCLKIAFEVNDKLQTQSIAFDFVFDGSGDPLIVEISYGYSPEGYDSCQGYWDKELNWYEGEFNPYGWMIEQIIR